MPTWIRFCSGEHTVSCCTDALPEEFAGLRAKLHDVSRTGSPEESRLTLCVEHTDSDHPDLILSLGFEPGPKYGLHPGVLLVPETKRLFVGAGTTLLAYDLLYPRRLWEDAADFGFWSWKRHGNVVLMSAELELAAWDLEGEKLWSAPVEPPWDYRPPFLHASKKFLRLAMRKSNDNRLHVPSGD